LINNTIGFIAANHLEYQSILPQMSKTLLSNDKSEENKQVKISKVLQEQAKEKEFIILQICKSDIDKAIKDLKEHKKLNQYYQPDYKLIVERYTDKILDVYGWYESLKQTIRTTDRTSMLGRDEL
jgi:hypothetical protein